MLAAVSCPLAELVPLLALACWCAQQPSAYQVHYGFSAGANCLPQIGCRRHDEARKILVKRTLQDADVFDSIHMYMSVELSSCMF